MYSVLVDQRQVTTDDLIAVIETCDAILCALQDAFHTGALVANCGKQKKSLLRKLPSVPLLVDFPTSFDFVNFFLPQASATAHRHLHNPVQPVIFILP